MGGFWMAKSNYDGTTRTGRLAEFLEGQERCDQDPTDSGTGFFFKATVEAACTYVLTTAGLHAGCFECVQC